ncbi:hypothetical protein DFJ58DRAFT_847319 [Suillus subalutaceus]|uniref:uncharacterized protein n=1 Tax=Suillus subalutaceus TaxID=48586 RepID=UPI001B85FAEC|nr:uncharacterized protein DFJ58DRAFT_847319 [Suillus subalutaceus]KAG1835863.1 hypothetical protein DFJ58DRAFT_847319 [Suillus subalutaceus]
MNDVVGFEHRNLDVVGRWHNGGPKNHFQLRLFWYTCEALSAKSHGLRLYHSLDEINSRNEGLNGGQTFQRDAILLRRKVAMFSNWTLKESRQARKTTVRSMDSKQRTVSASFQTRERDRPHDPLYQSILRIFNKDDQDFFPMDLSYVLARTSSRELPQSLSVAKLTEDTSTSTSLSICFKMPLICVPLITRTSPSSILPLLCNLTSKRGFQTDADGVKSSMSATLTVTFTELALVNRSPIPHLRSLFRRDHSIKNASFHVDKFKLRYNGGPMYIELTATMNAAMALLIFWQQRASVGHKSEEGTENDFAVWCDFDDLWTMAASGHEEREILPWGLRDSVRGGRQRTYLKMDTHSFMHCEGIMLIVPNRKEFVVWFNSGAWTTIPLEPLLPAVHAVLSSLDGDAIDLFHGSVMTALFDLMLPQRRRPEGLNVVHPLYLHLNQIRCSSIERGLQWAKFAKQGFKAKAYFVEPLLTATIQNRLADAAALDDGCSAHSSSFRLNIAKRGSHSTLAGPIHVSIGVEICGGPSDDWKKERGWIASTWELLSSLVQSSVRDQALRRTVLEVLANLTSNDQATSSLVLKSSLLSWIEMQTSRCHSRGQGRPLGRLYCLSIPGSGLILATKKNEETRGSDPHSLFERNMLGSTWPGVVRAMREVDPAIAVYPAEHLKSPAAHAEVQNRTSGSFGLVASDISHSSSSKPQRCLKSFATRIWNTKVNCFKDDAAEIAKIDEEMVKIVVDVGVYLPSHPDGSGIDVDRKSSRPIQSHSKASVNNDPLLPQKK